MKINKTIRLLRFILYKFTFKKYDFLSDAVLLFDYPIAITTINVKIFANYYYNHVISLFYVKKNIIKVVEFFPLLSAVCNAYKYNKILCYCSKIIFTKINHN